MASSGQRLPPHEIAQKLFDEEALRQILSSLVVCYFARGVYTTNIVSKYFKAIGVDATVDALSQMGREILKEKCAFKFREVSHWIEISCVYQSE